MKTFLSTRVLIILSFVALAIVSCSKKDDTVNPPVKPPVTQSGTPSIGAILDSGVVNTSTRVMKMALDTQRFALYNSDEQVSFASATVKVAFYVNNDGSIPTGDYSFSGADTKSPFTFDSASLVYVPGSDSKNVSSDQVVDGTISVNQQGTSYTFSLIVSLASGLTTSMIYSGPLDYADSKK